MENKNPQFHDHLKELMDEYAHLVYKFTRTFPREELYGITSQIRRSSLSVVLNYIEGFARRRSKYYKHFLEISYGSLQESIYLLEFSLKENILSSEDHLKAKTLANEIGAMLWGTIIKLKT